MYEGITALDTGTMEDIGAVQPTEDVQTETPAAEGAEAAPAATEVPPATDPEVTPTVDAEQPITEFEIEGIGKVTADEVKEWMQGNLRRKDYTKKTQELAQQRKEAEDALELFNYLKTNPHLVQELKRIDEGNVVNTNIMNKATPENELLQQVWYNQKALEVDRTLEGLRSTYGEVDEVKLFNTARELGTDNLEFVYKALAFEDRKVDNEALIRQAKEELKQELMQTKSATGTIAAAPATQMPTNTATLTAQEERVAKGMGLTKSEYMKWRDK